MKKTLSLLVLVLMALAACASQGAKQEISKERAIEIARKQISFEPGKVEAVKDTEQGRPVWKVTFYGKGVDATHPGLVSIVVLDRKTGELVTLAIS